MKILVAGNSQAACLMTAQRYHPKIAHGRATLAFHCMPGGSGPGFDITDGLLVPKPEAIHKDYRPFTDHAETRERRISEYDAIVVSALGSIGGGFKAYDDLMWRGLMYDHRPKTDHALPPISKACYREVIRMELANQHGFRFLSQLKEAYVGKIVVQRFPRPSSLAGVRPDWPLNSFYEDPLGAFRFFSRVRDEYLEETCAALSVDLLPYPDEAQQDDGLTPEILMEEDGVHPKREYGRLILKLLLNRLVPWRSARPK